MADPENPAPPQEPIPWWQSPTLRACAVAMAPGVVLGLKALHVTALSEGNVADILVALAGGIAGGVIIYRRVKAGANPESPAAPIKMRII